MSNKKYAYKELENLFSEEQSIRYYGQPNYNKGRLFLVDYKTEEIKHEFLPVGENNINWRDTLYTLIYTVFVNQERINKMTILEQEDKYVYK